MNDCAFVHFCAFTVRTAHNAIQGIREKCTKAQLFIIYTLPLIKKKSKRIYIQYIKAIIKHL